MKLKGQATIELTNVETGEKRVVKDDNMITNGISQILRPLPFETMTPMGRIFGCQDGSYTDDFTGNTNRSILKRTIDMLTGGLILFNSQLDEDPDNFIPPVGVETVGCGTAKGYSGTNTMAGSYNEAESGEIENGYKHVWDFSTAHGNGHIACACLTTREGGYTAGGTFPFDSQYRLEKYTHDGTLIQEGDQISRRLAQLNNHDINRRGTIGDTLYIDAKNNRMVCFHDVREISRNYCYGSTYHGTATDYTQNFWHKNKRKITLDVKRIPFTSVGIFDYLMRPGVVASKAASTTILGNTIKQVTVEMPNEIKTLFDTTFPNADSNKYMFYTVSCDEGFIYFTFVFHSSPSTTIGTNGELHVWKINAETFESSYIKLTNTTGKNMIFYKTTSSSEAIQGRGSLYVTNKYAFVITDPEGYMYRISMDDNTDVQQILWPNGSPFAVTLQSSLYSTYLTTPFFMEGKFYLGTYVYDPELNVMKYRNTLHAQMFGITTSIYDGSSGYDYQEGPVLPAYGIRGLFARRFRSNSTSSESNATYQYSKLAFSMLPEILVTINNLSKPVTKSSAETMKITYTLTWDDLEGGDS